MFIEGESSTEMFIIKSGCIRILKQEGQNTVELARLGPGSVVGELSLLDKQPRSATAQVIEDTTVTVIDEELFRRTMESIPQWLGTLIKLVVKRLRDTMKKTSDDIVLKSIGGVIQIILLLTEKETHKDNISPEIPSASVKEHVYATIGLGEMEIENIFLHLILKNFILIQKKSEGREYIIIKDRPALRLYMQYLRIHQRGGELIGESFTDSTFVLIDAMIEAGNKNSVTSKKIIRVEKTQVEIELQRRGLGRYIDRDSLEALIDAKLIAPADQDAVVSKHSQTEKESWIFNPEVMQNLLLLKNWLPTFREEIKF